MDVKRDILWRVYLSFILIVLVCILIIGKAFYIQQVQGNYWRSLSDSLHQRIIEIPAARGTIYSEDGQMLSTNIPQFDIYIDFRVSPLHEKSGLLFRTHIDSLSLSLAALFKDKSSEKYKEELTNAFEASVGNYELRKKISYREYLQLVKFPLFKLGRYKSGMIAEEKNIRLNPYENIGYRTIGLARDENKVGLEKSYDTVLNGRNGRQLVRAIAGGVTVPVQEGEFEIAPETGKDIVSTIDVFIQEVTEKALMNMMVKNEAQTGVAIVMEVKTGKIKAIANLGKVGEGKYAEDLNYAITPTEPGSTFKLVTLLSALEDGKVNLNSRVNLEGGVWKVSGQTVYDSEKHGKFDASILEAFEESSNVGMAKIAMAHYSGNVNEYFKHLTKLRLDSTSGLDLVGERQPRLVKPGSRLWGPTTLPWMAFGYNIEITPLQTLNLYNSIANNGIMMRPYLVNSIQEEGKIIKSISPKVYNAQLCKPSTIRDLRIALEGVCINGTGKTLFKNSLYKVAGKTGTAKVANGNKGYGEGIFQSSFAGYFPADNPQYTIVVIIKNKPHAANFYGASVAGPVFKEIADRLYSTYIQNKLDIAPVFAVKDSSLFNYSISKISLQTIAKQLSIPYQDSSLASNNWIQLEGKGKNLKAATYMISDTTMPNMTGMKLQDALWLCEKKGLLVKCVGKGKVVKQSIAQGEFIIKGQQIQIDLN
ncbi:MAG: transpeptidase family protein [Sediminibacterium sp.]|nr:transpeptidase family protein [Sediminibacterium sp.]